MDIRRVHNLHRRSLRGGRWVTALRWSIIFQFLCALVGPAVAQRLDSFEGDAPRWRLVDSDCEATLTGHEISPLMPRSGRACEMFEVSCLQGQRVLMAYPIEPTAVLNEFQPSVWVRCASSNIRLGVRVVFPQAVHPVTKGRLTTLIWGDSYLQPGSWQSLHVGRLADQLQQELVALRQQMEFPVNFEQPQVDALVLNVYTGPGRYRVQVDDLELTGMIPLASVGVPLPVDWREAWRWEDSTESAFGRGSSFPVWLQHRGEQPAWLGSLGFNGLWLEEVPSPALLTQIAEARMAAYSPPPMQPLAFDSQQLSALQGWVLGVALNREQMEMAKKNLAAAEQLPRAMRRPLVGEALEQYWLFSRMVSQTVVPSPVPESAGEIMGKRTWLTSTLQSVNLRSDGWVSVQAGPNPSIVEQCRVFEERIEGEAFEDRGLDSAIYPLGFRHEVTGAVMAGARGVLVRSQDALADPISNPSAGQRAMQAAMRWCNNDLRLWTPWLTKGQSMPPPTLGRTDYSAARWRLRDADLILVQNVAPGCQWCLPPTRNIPLSLRLPAGAEAQQSIRLTEGSMELMPIQISPGHQEWQVVRPAPVEIFLVTRNPQVLGYVRRRLEGKASEYAADQLEIASFCAEQATQLFDARFVSRSAALAEEAGPQMRGQQQRLAAIQNGLERGWRALQSQQPQIATAQAFEVIDLTHSMMHEAFVLATNSLATPQSSPFVLNPGTLKYHWRVADACERSQWQPVMIPGSQFSDLADMLHKGWSQQRRLQDLADLRVELVPGGEAGPHSLRMAAYSKSSHIQNLPEQRLSQTNPATEKTKLTSSAQPIPGGYEGASLRIRSASFAVKKGQFIRITGLASIRHISRDPASGVLFYDNQAGPSLGQLIRGSVGDRIPIELYRFVAADGEFRVLAECRGECDVQIENLAASVIEPATKRKSFVTNPLMGVEGTGYSEQLEPLNP